VTEILAVVIGFVLGFGVAQWERRRRLKAHWAALDVEIEMAGRAATTYRNDSVKAPLYRLPTIAFEHSLPALLAEGALKPAELESLMSFGLLVQDINRGLDQAADAAPRQISDEARRLDVKCRHLIAEPDHEASIHRARAVVSAHLKSGA
jgi:hypothetical protein